MYTGERFRNKQAMLITLNGTASFDPMIAAGSGFTRWDLGDGSIKNNDNSFTHIYGTTSIYSVVCYKRYMNKITSVQMQSDDLISVDMHAVTNLGGGGVVLLYSNPNLQKVIFPIQNPNVSNLTQIRLENCGIVGALDMSGMTRMQSTLWIYSNSSITSIDLSGVITGGGSLSSTQVHNLASCNSIDISGLITIRGTLQFRSSPNLSSITFPNNTGISTGNMGVVFGYQNPNITTLDFSDTENIGGNVQLYQNTSMTSLLFSSSPVTKFTQLRVENCDLTTLDMSNQTLNGSIRFQSNSNLTTFLAPSVTGGDTVNLLWGYSCNLTGVLNLAPIEILRSSFIVRDNPLLTGLTFFATPHSQVLNTFHAYNCNLTGALNVSMFEALSGNFDINGNSLLTSVTNPTSVGVFTSYNASDCDLTGVISFSGLTGLGGSFDANNNPNLTGLTMPTSTEQFSAFNVSDCDLTGAVSLAGLSGGFVSFVASGNSNLTGITFAAAITQATNGTVFRVEDCGLSGTINLSQLDKLGGIVWLFNNPLLTAITFPTSTVAITDLNFSNCNILNGINLSNLNIENAVNCSGNANMTGITNPTNSNVFGSYNASGCTNLGFVDMTLLSGLFDSVGCSTNFNACGMTTAQVNEMLVDFDTNSSGAISGRSLNLGGVGMSAPDAVSGGFDGVAAKASLIVKGYSVTTN